MRTLLLASHNPGKARELAALLAGLPLRVCSLADYPAVSLPPETGAAYGENAALKARAAAQAGVCWALGDDSGLEVPALGGAPGLRSSRVAPSDPERIAWLLERMRDLPEDRRPARFVCALALADEGGELLGAWEGTAEGLVLPEPRGSGGFGYDPVFLYPPAGLTFAEMTAEQKAAVSHRGAALRAFRSALPDLLCVRGGREES